MSIGIFSCQSKSERESGNFLSKAPTLCRKVYKCYRLAHHDLILKTNVNNLPRQLIKSKNMRKKSFAKYETSVLS